MKLQVLGLPFLLSAVIALTTACEKKSRHEGSETAAHNVVVDLDKELQHNVDAQWEQYKNVFVNIEQKLGRVNATVNEDSSSVNLYYWFTGRECTAQIPITPLKGETQWTKTCGDILAKVSLLEEYILVRFLGMGVSSKIEISALIISGRFIVDSSEWIQVEESTDEQSEMGENFATQLVGEELTLKVAKLYFPTAFNAKRENVIKVKGSIFEKVFSYGSTRTARFLRSRGQVSYESSSLGEASIKWIREGLNSDTDHLNNKDIIATISGDKPYNIIVQDDDEEFRYRLKLKPQEDDKSVGTAN